MKVQAACILTVLLAAVLVSGCPRGPITNADFTSADIYGGSRDGLLAGDMEDVATTNETEDSSTRELVEPDVIRQEGNLLYVLNQYRGLTVVDLRTERVLSQTPTVGYPRDLYLVDGRAYVLVSYAQELNYEETMLSVSYGSKLYVFNVENPAAVTTEGAFSFEGDLVDSRMVGSVIYAVCSDYSWYDTEDADTVAVDKATKSYGSTWAVSLDIADPSNIGIADTLSFSGYGNLIQATNYAIFSVSTNWNYTDNTATSVVNYIDITDPQGAIVLRGAAEIPGYMADRFKMDAWEGVLRLVTNTGWPSRQTYITTLDITNPDDPALLGQTTLESASGETLYATRFDGPMAYIVTYLTVDPLFVVDLSNPAAPQVKGELKIPGWSTHIEPRGDRLLALGVDDTDGNRKVMVSLFDVSAPETPTRLAYASFGDGWSWSSAYNDVKAFTVMDDLLLIPVSGWTDAGGSYDRLQFVSWTPDTLDAKGYVDLQGSAIRSFEYGDYSYAVTQEQLAVIDTMDLDVPTVAASVTLAEDIVDVQPLQDNWIVEVISRNDEGDVLVRAAIPETDAYGNELLLPDLQFVNSYRWDNGVVIVGVAYEYEPNDAASYRVHLVDFTLPDQPVLLRDWQIPMEPWRGGWSGYYPVLEDAVVEASKTTKQYWWGYDGGDDNAILVGDYLILRGIAEKYDLIFGSENPLQGAALLDLTGVEPAYLVGLGYKEVVQLDEAGDLVYVTTKEQVGKDAEGRGICAYYLHTFNPETREMADAVNVPGVFLGHVTATDIFLFEDYQYRNTWETTTVLRSVDIQEGAASLLDSKQLGSGYLDNIAKGNRIWYAGQYFDSDDNTTNEEDGEGDTAVASDAVPYYDSQYVIGYHEVDEQGLFTDAGHVLPGRLWCSLLGVHTDNAYISIESAALAGYNFTVHPPLLDVVTPVMGYPQKIRFGSDTAYIPLGYGGLGILPL